MKEGAVDTATIEEMRRLRASDLTYLAIAIRTGVCDTTVRRYAGDRARCTPPRRIDRAELVRLADAGLPYSEVARRVGSTPGSVKVLVCRERQERRAAEGWGTAVG